MQMTYAEFVIRSFSYHKSQQEDWAKFRKVAYMALLGSHYDHKKIPKTEKQFFPLPLVDGGNIRKSVINPELVAKFMQQSKDYYDKRNEK